MLSKEIVFEADSEERVAQSKLALILLTSEVFEITGDHVKEFISSHIEAIEHAVDSFNVDLEIAIIQNFKTFLNYSNSHNGIFIEKLKQHLSGELKQKKPGKQKKQRRQLLAFNKLIEGFAKVLQDQLDNKLRELDEVYEEFESSDEEEDTELSEEYKKEIKEMCESIKSLKITDK